MRDQLFNYLIVTFGEGSVRPHQDNLYKLIDYTLASFGENRPVSPEKYREIELEVRMGAESILENYNDF